MKKKIRLAIQNEKEKISGKEKRQQEKEIFKRIEQSHIFQDAQNIGLYHALRDEVQTELFLKRWMDIKNLYIPQVENKTMQFRKYSDNAKLIKSNLGVLELSDTDIIDSKKLDLIIVPGIAFDKNCNRLGRGGGYYDRFLETTNAYKIAIGYNCQIIENLETETHDIKMDCIISASGIYQQ